MLSLRRNCRALVFVAMGLALAGSRSAASTRPVLHTQTRAQDTPVARISAEELDRLLNERNVVLVDVRPHDAYLHAHLPDAVSIPLDELAGSLARLRAASARIVLYCGEKAGLKSGRAAALLRQHGFEHVSCLDGGFEGWVASGRVVFVQPTET